METSAINQHYVYIYLDPRKPGDYSYTVSATGEVFKFDYEPFYVGMGKGSRFIHHLAESKRNSKILRNPLKCNIINKIIRDTNSDPIILKVKEKISQEKSKQIEIILIKIIGRRHIKTGPLANLTEGGEGTNGYKLSRKQRKHLSSIQKGRKQSEESIKKRSAKMKGHWGWCKGKPGPNLGKTFSKKWKKELSIAHIGNRPSEESKLKNINFHRKYFYSLSNKKDFFKFYTRSQSISIRGLFKYYNSDIINYKGIIIERRRINNNV